MPKVLIETYGCTLNRSDSDIMASLLRQHGYSVDEGIYTGNGSHDYIILNTCTVKQPTEQRLLHRLRGMSGLGKRLIVTGCLASASPDLVKAAAPNASLLSTSNTQRIVEAMRRIESNADVHYTSYTANDKLSDLGLRQEQLIVHIPLSEGCLSGCTFCETRFARGPLHSFSEQNILKAVEMSAQKGAIEIDLTSQDIGAYGADRKTNIAELLPMITDISGEFMVRVGMLNPEHLHRFIDQLIEAYGHRKVFRFMHLPVQSGSNRILAAMKRRYSREEFHAYVKELRKKIRGISIATDVIVGYPGETEEEFGSTVSLIDEVLPTFTNISKFGIRPHTQSAFVRRIPNAEVKKRSVYLSRHVRGLQHKVFGRLVGRREKVLVTEENSGMLGGRDVYYRPFALGRRTHLHGKTISARITGNTYAYLIGEPA